MPTPDFSAATGLAAWWEAGTFGLSDGATISAAWPDSSGHGVSATPSGSPTYKASAIGGKPGVRFTGTQNFATGAIVTSAFNTAMTVYLVGQRLALGGSYNFWYGVGTGNKFSPHIPALAQTTVNQLVGDVSNSVEEVQMWGDSAASTPNSGTTLVLGDPFVLCLSYDGTNCIISANGFENGQWMSSVSGGGGSLGFTGEAFTLGMRGDGSFPIQGYICEVLLCQAAHSRTERKSIERQLRQKYGIVPGNLVSVCGDSIPNGYFAAVGNDQASLAIASLPFPWHGQNMAQDGTTVSTMETVATSYLDPYVLTDRAKHAAVLWGGTNDVTGSGGEDTTIFNKIKTWHQNRRTAGYKTVACPIIPRSNFNPSMETIRQSVNAMIVAQWATFADGYADFISNTHFDAQADTADTTYYQADGIHLTATGYQLASSILEPVIAGLNYAGGGGSGGLRRVGLEGLGKGSRLDGLGF